MTGGSGFMGSHFVRYLYNHYSNYKIINLDLITYAGNPENLSDIEEAEASLESSKRRYEHIKGDVCDAALVDRLFREYNFKLVFHFAAETHVDRSIFNFSDFIRTNVEGTRVLLEATRVYGTPKMIHISTDEVYGDVPEGCSVEDSPLNPSNPYSASKAAADMLARTYAKVYNTPLAIIRSGNNYGSHQYPEKLIPLTITNLLEGRTIPVHGEGTHVRSWVHVEDFCRAVDTIAHSEQALGPYNIEGEQKSNIDIIKLAAWIMGKDHSQHIEFTKDRPSADLRYAPHAGKLQRELSWKRQYSIEEALHKIIDWYRKNEPWWRAIKTKKEFLDHYEKQSKAKWY